MPPVVANLSGFITKIRTGLASVSLTLEEQVAKLLPTAWFDATETYAKSKIAVDGFDASSHLVTTDANDFDFDYNENWSIVTWARVSSTGGRMFSKRTASPNIGFEILVSTSKQEFILVQDGSNFYRIDSAQTLADDGTFYMITIVWNGDPYMTSPIIYIGDTAYDGLSNSGSGTVNSSISNSNLYHIGKRADGSTGPYPRPIDQHLIFNKSLSSTEVSALYNSGSGLNHKDLDGTETFYSNIVAWYDFNVQSNFGRNYAEESHAVAISGSKYFELSNQTYTDLSSTADWGIGGWVKVTDELGSFGAKPLVFASDTSINYNNRLILCSVTTGSFTPARRLFFALYDSANPNDRIAIASVNTINLNEYTHIYFRYRGSSVDSGTAAAMDVFINGIKQTVTNNDAGTYTSSGNPNYFRFFNISGLGVGTGILDEVDQLRIDNTALSDSEVSDVYNSGQLKNYTDLSASELASIDGYYDFNEQTIDLLGQDSFGSNDLTPTSIVDADLVGGVKDARTQYATTGSLNYFTAPERFKFVDESFTVWYHGQAFTSTGNDQYIFSRSSGQFDFAMGYDFGWKMIAYDGATNQIALTSATANSNQYYFQSFTYDYPNEQFIIRVYEEDGSLIEKLTFNLPNGFTLRDFGVDALIAKVFAGSPPAADITIKSLAFLNEAVTDSKTEDWVAIGANGTYSDYTGSTANLVEWYDFENSAQLGQASVNNNISHAVQLDGSSKNFIVNTTDFNFGDTTTDFPFSISCWLNPDDISSFRAIATGQGASFMYSLFLDSGRITFRLYDGGSTPYITRSYNVALSINTWHHIVATYDGSSSSTGLSIYLNGTKVDNTTANSGTYVAMHPYGTLAIGLLSGGNRFSGKIDELAIYQDELTATEVADLYNGGVFDKASNLIDTTNLVSEWSFDDHSGVTSGTIGKDGFGTNDLTPVNITTADLVNGYNLNLTVNGSPTVGPARETSLDLLEVGSPTVALGHIEGKAAGYDGVTKWSDRSGNGNDAEQTTLANVPLWLEDQLGTDSDQDVVYFDGVSDEIIISNEADFDIDKNTDHSIVALFRIDQEDVGTLYSKGTWPTGNFLAYNNVSGDYLDYILADGTNNIRARYSTPLVGFWKMVTFTYDGTADGAYSGFTCYDADTLVSTTQVGTPVTSSILNNDNPEIGNLNGLGGYEHEGAIAQLLVFNGKKLEQSEVTTIKDYYNEKYGLSLGVAPPAPTAWTPAELTTAYWWDASDASTITHSSNSVSQWTDKNQSANIVQASGGNQPTTNTRTINSLNTLDFNGSTSKMTYSGPQLTAYTKFIVFELDATLNNANNLVSGVTSGPTGGANGSDALFQHFSGGYRLFQDGVQPYGLTAVPNGQGTLICATAGPTPNNAIQYIDGTLVTLSGASNPVLNTGTSLTGDWEIGTFFGSGYLNGKLAEVIVVPSILSQTDREKLEGYTAHKWGLTASLPVSHPYKSSAPTV